MGLFGPPNIEKLKAKKDVRGLIKALEYQKNKDVASKAAKALGEIGDARAVEPLVATLKDDSVDVRKAAAEALGQIVDVRAVEPLVAALKDKDGRVRWSAAEALDRIGDARAVEPLITALGDDWWDVREAAAEALHEMGWQPDEGADGAAYWIAKGKWDRCVQIGAPAVELLIAALKDGHEYTRRDAVGALGQIGDIRAVEPLIAALKDRDWCVRRNAAETMGQIGDTRAVEPLIAAFKDRNRHVRRAAAGALVKIGEQAVGMLVATLRDRDGDVRQAAAEVLDQIGAPVVEPLIAAVKDKDKDVTLYAAKALSQIGDARAVEPLIAALKDRDRDVRKAAAEALHKMGWQPDEGADGAAYWIAKGKWDRCVQIGGAAAEPLCAALPSLAAAMALGKLGEARAVKPLIAALKDGHRSVRKSAAKALVALYQSGRLDEEHRRLILKQRRTITQGHEDREYWKDRSSDCYDAHEDTGIGIEFTV